MGLLFQDGKLLFDGYGDLLFSDDPYNCECCNPVTDCVCPESDEYDSPKYVDEYEVVISNIPNTYNETRTTDSTSLLGVGNSEITLQLTGFAALNGTYATSLKDPDDGTSCSADNNACVFNDSAAGCIWEGNLMRVSITGTLYSYSYEQLFGNAPTEDERTYNLFGTAAVFGAGRPEYIYCSLTAYRIIDGVCREYGGLGFTLFKDGTTDAMSFPGGIRYTCTTGTLFYNNPPDIEPWAIIPGLLSGGFFGNGGIVVDPCNTEALITALIPRLGWGGYCNDPDCDYTIALSVDNCSGSYTITSPLGGGQTTNITFAYDGFAGTIDSNCTLLP